MNTITTITITTTSPLSQSPSTQLSQLEHQPQSHSTNNKNKYLLERKQNNPIPPTKLSSLLSLEDYHHITIITTNLSPQLLQLVQLLLPVVLSTVLPLEPYLVCL